nr:DUF885 family protein [Saprospiraceae bacterium]
MKMILPIILFQLVFFGPSAICSIQAGEIMPEYIQRFTVDRAALDRKYTLRYSDGYFDRMEKLVEDWHQIMAKIPYEDLSGGDKIDYHLLKNELNRSGNRLKGERFRYEEMKFVVDFADPLVLFVEKRRRGATLDSERIATDMSAAAEAIGNKRSEIEGRGPFGSWQEAKLAADIVEDLKENVNWAFSFYHLYHPDFSWWVEKPHEELNKGLEKYGEFLREFYENPEELDDGSGIFGQPLGSEALAAEINSEMIPYSAEELIEFAWEEFNWCQKELKRSAEKLGYGANYMDAIEYVKNSWVYPGEQPELINFYAEEAIDFLEERDLISIPEMAKETWRMRMLSPEMQRFAPFFLGGEQVQIAFPTSTMDHDLKMMSLRGNNPHFSRAVVHHELIPGHHLQQFMNNRYNVQRRAFRTPFWVEGWALYWEMMLWEKGFARNAEDEIGMLFWRIHRAARIVFSLKYHLGEMTAAECIDFLVEEVGHERANAEAEVRRSFEGSYGPLYQISYMIGGLQMMALRKEVVDTGLMDEKSFHDRILYENSMPIELLRALLKEEFPGRNHQSSWYFMDSLRD